MRSSGCTGRIIREDVFESIRSTANPELNPPDFIMVNWWLWHYAAATVLNRRNIFCGPRPQKRFPYSVCKLKPFQIWIITRYSGWGHNSTICIASYVVYMRSSAIAQQLVFSDARSRRNLLKVADANIHGRWDLIFVDMICAWHLCIVCRFVKSLGGTPSKTSYANLERIWSRNSV